MTAYIIELMDELDDIGQSYVPRRVFLSKEAAQKEVEEWSSDTELRRWGYVRECEVVTNLVKEDNNAAD